MSFEDLEKTPRFDVDPKLRKEAIEEIESSGKELPVNDMGEAVSASELFDAIVNATIGNLRASPESEGRGVNQNWMRKMNRMVTVGKLVDVGVLSETANEVMDDLQRRHADTPDELH